MVTVRTAAAYGLLHKKARLFSFNSTNAILEFFIEGSPGIVETHLDSRKVSHMTGILHLIGRFTGSRQTVEASV